MRSNDSGPGTLLYHHNGTDVFSGSDERIRAMFGRIDEVAPDGGFVDEACNGDVRQERLDNVCADLERRGFAARAIKYSQPARHDQHYAIGFVSRELLVADAQFLRFAGRGALIWGMIEKGAGRPFKKFDIHLSDGRENRKAEVGEIGQYLEKEMQRAEEMHQRALPDIEEVLQHAEEASLEIPPIVMDGDFNSAVDRSLFAASVHAAGCLFSVPPFPWLAAENESGRHKTMPGRMASICLRAAGQLSGKEIQQLMNDGWFFSANTEHLRTSYVPHLPGAVLKALEFAPLVKRWMLDQPHIEADYFLANVGNFSDFRVYDRLPGDEHLGTSVVYRLADETIA